MAQPHQPRYRIDARGCVWQKVAPGPRTPQVGERKVGWLTSASEGRYPGKLRLAIGSAPDASPFRSIDVWPDDLIDERPGAPSKAAPRPTRPIAGGEDAPKLKAKVTWRDGVLAELELPDGRRFYGVLCTGCGANLMAASLGRTAIGRNGPVTDIWHPLACPGCGAPLLPVPSSIVRALPGAGPS